MARRRLLFHLAVMVSGSVMYKTFARALSTSSQQLIIRLHDIPGFTGFCGLINASKQDINIFEFSAKFMYIATINDNNLVLKGRARWISDATLRFFLCIDRRFGQAFIRVSPPSCNSRGESCIRPIEINPTGRNDDQGGIFFIGNHLYCFSSQINDVSVEHKKNFREVFDE
jgi:hypothetical protein